MEYYAAIKKNSFESILMRWKSFISSPCSGDEMQASFDNSKKQV